jgi:hypothetical protein
MESISIWHWLIVIVMLASAIGVILGIVRAVKNGAPVHAVASAFVPMYGLIYFLVAAKR